MLGVIMPNPNNPNTNSQDDLIHALRVLWFMWTHYIPHILSQISSLNLGSIVTIGYPPPFDPFYQNFQLLELKYGVICRD